MAEENITDVVARQVEPTSEIVRVFQEATYCDNSAVYASRLERLSRFVVTGTEENVKEAKKVRAALNGLASDAGAARMSVQRAIKAHPIGIFAFTKSELEKRIEHESKRLDAEIKKATNAPSVQLNEDVNTYVCFIRGTLAPINKLAVYANEQGLVFENHGPAMSDGHEPKGEEQKSEKEANKQTTENPFAGEGVGVAKEATPPPPPADDEPLF